MSKQAVGIGIIFLALLTFTGFYCFNVYKDRNAFSPEKIFEAAFDESVLRAENLTGVKDESTQYDVRLHFKYPHEPIPKNNAEYKTAWCNEARNYFNAVFPNEKPLQEMQFLKFKKRLHNDTTMVTNEWLLYNPHTDDVYYRIFGTAR